MLNKEEIINKIAYKVYETRTKDPENNPLIGYGDSDRDYGYACRVVDRLLTNKLDEDDVDLFSDILIEGKKDEQKI
jgi:hypothetical protein